MPPWFAQLGREHLVVAARAGEELANGGGLAHARRGPLSWAASPCLSRPGRGRTPAPQPRSGPRSAARRAVPSEKGFPAARTPPSPPPPHLHSPVQVTGGTR